MAKKDFSFLTDIQKMAIFGKVDEPGDPYQKKGISFKLTNEAIDMLDKEAKLLGVRNRTEALEVIIREIWDLRKKRKRGG